MPTLIESMKELKLIEKRMETNIERINKYASQPSNEKPMFGTPEEQRKEVAQLVQANEDLTQTYTNIKAQVDYTNLITKVEIDGKEYTIHQLLQIRRKLAHFMTMTYKNLNEDSAKRAMRLAVSKQDGTVKPERFYDEAERNKKLDFWQSLYHTIDGRLESVNAITETAFLPTID